MASKILITPKEHTRYKNSAWIDIEEAFELLEGGLAQKIKDALQDEAKEFTAYRKNVARAKKLGITIE